MASKETASTLVSSNNSRRAAATRSSPGSMPPCGICHSHPLTTISGPSLRPRPAKTRPAGLNNAIPTFARYGRSTVAVMRETPSFAQREQARIASGGGRIDRDDLFGREALQVVRAAGLGAGPGQAGAAEGLGPDDGADHVAVDVAIADAEPFDDALDRGIDAGMDAESQAEAGGFDGIEDLLELARPVAH